MMQALGVSGPAPPPQPEDEIGNAADILGDAVGDLIEPGAIPEQLQGEIEGLGLNLSLGRDGSISLGPADRRREPAPPPPPRDDRRPPEDEPGI